MNRRQIGLRITDEQFDRLHAEAFARGVSVNWLCSKLLDEFLGALKPAGEFRLTELPD